jgi:hypothetical protein
VSSDAESFENHLRAAAGISQSSNQIPEQKDQSEASQADGSLARGLREARLR